MTNCLEHYCFSPCSFLCVLGLSAQFCPRVENPPTVEHQSCLSHSPLRGFLQASDLNIDLELVVHICCIWAPALLTLHSSACLWGFPKLPQSQSYQIDSLSLINTCLITSSAVLASCPRCQSSSATPAPDSK